MKGEWIEMSLRLCDDDGVVSERAVIDSPMPVGGESYIERHRRLSGKSHDGGWGCTGHAHYRGPIGGSSMTTSEAKNLEAIDKAIKQHNANCGAPLIEIRMSPYEVERLDWPEIRGIPIKPDETMGTGRFRLICNGQHGEAPAEAEVIELHQPVTVPERVAA